MGAAKGARVGHLTFCGLGRTSASHAQWARMGVFFKAPSRYSPRLERELALRGNAAGRIGWGPARKLSRLKARRSFPPPMETVHEAVCGM